MVCWANHASAIGHVAATLVDSGDSGDTHQLTGPSPVRYTV